MNRRIEHFPYNESPFYAVLGQIGRIAEEECFSIQWFLEAMGTVKEMIQSNLAIIEGSRHRRLTPREAKMEDALLGFLLAAEMLTALNLDEFYDALQKSEIMYTSAEILPG
ncbi:MAG: hypothetical protein RDU59_12325 [Thermodesulfobacteriota bacterium]|nr:hypothetical protein [Thermodesulfobacteriota bacterium]